MNKKLIAILTLVMFAVTLLPMGAFAATKTSVVGNVPMVTDTNYNEQFANIYINEDSDGNINSGDVLIFTLPSELEFQAALPGFDIKKEGAGSGIKDVDYTVDRKSDQSVFVTLYGGTIVTSSVDKLTVNLGSIKVAEKGNGDIVVNLDAAGTAITGGDFVVGRFVSGSAAVSAVSKETRSDGKAKYGTIRITENATKAMGLNKEITLKLPTDFSWVKVAEGTLEVPGYAERTGGTVGTGTVMQGTRGLKLEVIDLDERTMKLEVTSQSSGGPGVVDILTYVDADSDARLGEVEVSISGEASGDVVIGTFAEYSVEIKAEEAKELIAGKTDQKMAKFTVKDVIDGSLLPSRTIKFELPDGVRFEKGNVPSYKLNGTSKSDGKIGDEGRVYTITLPSTLGGKTEIELKDVKLDIAPRFIGDVELTVSGTAGAKGSAVVATVEPAIKLDTTTATLKLGVQNQELNDILLTETDREVFVKDGFVVLELDNGLTFTSTPKVEVIEGNAEIDIPARASNNTQVEFKIKSESTKASTIKVSGIKVTADRTVPEGDIKVTVKGNALVDPMFKDGEKDIKGNTITQKDWSISVKSAAAVKVATVVTPAGENVVQPVQMTVGSTVYTIDGVEVQMDVAPYIKSDRTYFPVRFIANALGITDENVVWDPAQRAVTIFRANRIVQVTIGSTTMLVNGVPVTMDVAPEITAERTMLPIRFVAQGLGVNVEWDAATQTVTLN